MSFVPAKFSKFGSSASDVFSKKYTSEVSVKATNATSVGSFEASLVLQPAVRGTVKATGKKGVVSVEAEAHTDLNKESKIQLKRPCLLTNKLNWTVTASTVDGEKSLAAGPYGVLSVEGEFTRPNVLATGLFKTNGTKSIFRPALSFGYDGVSLGGQATLDVQARKVADLAFGAQVVRPAFTAAVFTKNNTDVLNVSLFRSGADERQEAAQLSTDLALKRPVLSLGAQRQLDKQTLVKAKADVSVLSRDVSLAGVIEHRLASPQMSVAVSASVVPDFKVFGAVPANSFGAAFTLGDY